MRPHPEMRAPDGMVCNLPKSLYRLKQAPRNWNVYLNSFLKHLEFMRCMNDTCLYTRMYHDYVVLLAVFVDDVLIACQCPHVLMRVKEEFKDEFTVTDMGEARVFLGVRIRQLDGKVSLDQQVYYRKILVKYGYLTGVRNYTEVPTSRDANILHIDPPLNKAQMRFTSTNPYAELFGALMYLSVLTRPDVAYALRLLSCHMSTPTYMACKACSRVLNYLSRYPTCA